MMQEQLDRTCILAGLSEIAHTGLKQLEIFQTLGSTSNYLFASAQEGSRDSGVVCISEQQTAGKGRQGRRWITTFEGGSLALSLLWRFNCLPEALSGLSLVAGIAVARALRDFGVHEVGLKWPNDVWWCKRKLGGILLESSSSIAESFRVVTGIGLNIALSQQDGELIDQPWVDLQEVLGVNVQISRNRLAALLINELITAFIRFQSDGFSGFANEWTCFDLTFGKRVCLKLPNATVTGIAKGVDATGALLLETQSGQFIPYRGGEISLRIDE